MMGNSRTPSRHLPVSLAMSSFFLLLLISIPVVVNGVSDELSTLLEVKKQLGDPVVLQPWNAPTPHCNWNEVKCSGGMVVSIDLSKMNINASFPEAICGLKNLTKLTLAYNNLKGEFPRAVYNCSRLQYLDISQNYFEGVLPDDIATLSSLQSINVVGNSFEGLLPPSIGKMIELRTLQLNANNFSGSIPKEIGNLYNLETLGLAWNGFSSEIPTEVGNLRKLTYLWMAGNSLVGTIPASFGNLSSLEHLDLSVNKLDSNIPETLFTLKNLSVVYLFHNHLSGEIPRRIESMNLKEIDLSKNNLTGQVPEAFESLNQLQIAHLSENNLSGELPSGLGRIPSLQAFSVFINNMSGALPPEMGLHSKLEEFEVSDNHFTGELPQNLCAGGALIGVAAFSNNLSGKIPQSLGNCTTLKTIQVYGNNMSGEIPEAIWRSPALEQLMVNNNSFSGRLPTTLGPELSRIDIRDNMFSGPIPDIISTGKNLTVFLASNNQLSGGIPIMATTSSSLTEIRLDGNRLSGRLPSKIISWQKLSILSLSRNQFSGKIPENLGRLTVLNYLDLSENHLSGGIPPLLGQLKPTFLNLSFNKLSGSIPFSFDNAAYIGSFIGNDQLCTAKPELTDLPKCGTRGGASKMISSKLLAGIISVSVVAVLFVAVMTLLLIREYRNKKPRQDTKSWKITSFQRISFNEDTVLDSLVEINRIGSGGSGKVYRIQVEETGEYVAVKKIWSRRKLHEKLEQEFAAEVKILGALKHTNIVKLLCCISNEDSKLLVYEYLENSSLDKWLHGRKKMTELWSNLSHETVFDWPLRLQIAVGAAQGLCYMHHDCSPPIIHRDIKSSNILLDSNFNAKIADFGVAEILPKEGEAHTMATVAGSFGYIAPEYGYTRRVNEKVDVYSFGVVLLELVTGREAGDGGESTNLAEWSWKQFGEASQISECFDEDINKQSNLEEMTKVFKLGLLCTTKSPASRPSMKDVLQVLRKCQQNTPREKKENEFDVTPLIGKSKSFLVRYGFSKKKTDPAEDDYSLV